MLPRWLSRGAPTVGKHSALRLLYWKLRCNTMSIQSCTWTVHINSLSVALLTDSHAPSITTQKPLIFFFLAPMFGNLPFMFSDSPQCPLLSCCPKPCHSVNWKITKRWQFQMSNGIWHLLLRSLFVLLFLIESIFLLKNITFLSQTYRLKMMVINLFRISLTELKVRVSVKLMICNYK